MDSGKTRKTKEDLEAENQKLIEDLEKEETSQEELEEEETPTEEPQEEDTEEEIAPEPEEEESEEEREELSEEEPDYKKKFTESSREAQKIHAKNRKVNEAWDEARKIEDVTEDELRAKYTDWDVLDETNKQIAKDAYISSKRWETVDKGVKEGQKIEKWGEDVDKFIDDPENLIKYPQLEGKEDEFKLYANGETRHAIPFDVLVPAFLHQHKETQPKNKGRMFPEGSGGLNEKPKPKSDKISVEESEVLRKTDFNKYREFLKAGKIDNTI